MPAPTPSPRVVRVAPPHVAAPSRCSTRLWPALLWLLLLLTPTRATLIVRGWHPVASRNAAFAPQPPHGGVEGVLQVTVPQDACEPLHTTTVRAGVPWVALIRRSPHACDFVTKVLHAQAAGAVAVVVYDDVATSRSLVMMAQPPPALPVAVPAAFVNGQDGEWLRAHTNDELVVLLLPPNDGPWQSLLSSAGLTILASVLCAATTVWVLCSRRPPPPGSQVRRLTDAQVKAIPTVRQGGPEVAMDAAHNTCAVCLDDYTNGQLLRLLPCRHRFHPHCIDRWLRCQAVCPVCKLDLLAYRAEHTSFDAPPPPSPHSRAPSSPPHTCVDVAVPASAPPHAEQETLL